MEHCKTSHYQHKLAQNFDPEKYDHASTKQYHVSSVKVHIWFRELNVSIVFFATNISAIWLNIQET